MSGRQRFAVSLFPLAVIAAAAYAAWLLAGASQFSGRFGYTPDAAGAREFAREAGSFREVGAEALEKAAHKDVFLYRYANESHRRAYGRDWKCLDQGDAGTCVSFAFALASYTAQAVDHLEGRQPDPPPAVATEPIYGGARTAGVGRNAHTGGDGATGFGAARWLSGNCPGRPDIGGVLYRQSYGPFDLSAYSIPLSRQWGRSGVPAELARLAFKTKATRVANVTTWDELVASLGRGSPVVLASNVGYGRLDNRMPVRDAQGFLARGKAWGHAMVVTATRHDREGALIQNSWGASWCSGPKWPPDQPDGSFWADRVNVQAALSQGDCWAVGGIDGFAWRELDHGIWLENNQ